MNKKIILSADSTCDIGKELQEKYGVRYFHFHIQVGDKSYVDIEEITPEEIYDAWLTRGILPKTAAINSAEYYSFFKEWVAKGYEVVHINIGSALSSAHQNCLAAAAQLGHVYPVDSANLSTGIGHLVVKAGEMIESGLSAEEVAKKITALRGNVHSSFLLDTLEFMKAGGRCSAITAFGANLLNLKPCIEVDCRNNGKMGVGKKYRGSMEKCLDRYIRDKIAGRDDLDLSRVFITHSGSPESDILLAKREIEKLAPFKEIYVTRASGTISSHCGPRTLGVLFMTKD